MDEAVIDEINKLNCCSGLENRVNIERIYNYLDVTDSTADMNKKLIPKIKAILPHLFSMCILKIERIKLVNRLNWKSNF